MTIETKFSVNDLVQYKFQKNSTEENHASCYEVISIFSETCSAGSQIFYNLRPIHLIYDKDYKGGKVERKFIDVTPGYLKNDSTVYARFREDELKAAAQDVIDLVKGDL